MIHYVDLVCSCICMGSDQWSLMFTGSTIFTLVMPNKSCLTVVVEMLLWLGLLCVREWGRRREVGWALTISSVTLFISLQLPVWAWTNEVWVFIKINKDKIHVWKEKTEVQKLTGLQREHHPCRLYPLCGSSNMKECTLTNKQKIIIICILNVDLHVSVAEQLVMPLISWYYVLFMRIKKIQCNFDINRLYAL